MTTEVENKRLNAFSDVPVSLEVKIGDVACTLGDIMQLSPGSVISTNVKLYEKVELLMDGKTIAKGILVEEDGFFAVEVAEVI